MEIVLFHHSSNKDESKRYIEYVWDLGILTDLSPCSFYWKHNNFSNINLSNGKEVISFNRFDKNLIKRVKELFTDGIIMDDHLNYQPDGNWEGCLYLVFIDTRFKNQKYWKIRPGRAEGIEILKDDIIEDLYNNNLQS